MADFFDYIQWRGDLEISSSDFNQVDALLFCQLSYLNLMQIAHTDFKDSISLKELS
jgi:hypothetical protein